MDAQISQLKKLLLAMEARIPDNEEQQPLNQVIHEDGETAYFATIPVKAMVSNVKKPASHQAFPTQLVPLSATILCTVYYT